MQLFLWLSDARKTSYLNHNVYFLSVLLIASTHQLEKVKAQVYNLDEQLESISNGWKNPKYQMLFTTRAQVRPSKKTIRSHRRRSTTGHTVVIITVLYVIHYCLRQVAAVLEVTQNQVIELQAKTSTVALHRLFR